MTVVYDLWHIRPNAFGAEDSKRIGTYSTTAKAERAIARLRVQPGFRDFPDGFKIFDNRLDQDGWTEGFISVREAMYPEGAPALPVLSGLRVIAVEQYGAGPYGSMQLADLGAEVIKIENPADGGDMSRRVGPFFLAPEDSQFFHSFNRNKKSITLDLKKPAAREVLRRLAARADASFDNLRGDLPAKLGLTYAALAPANPKIVCAHLSAYGRDGPRAAWPGYDYLMQAETGYLSLTGEPDGPPARMGLSIVDLMTGLFAAFALVSGVLSARETGHGRDLDVSLFDTALQNLCYLATWYLNAGHVQGREPRSAHPSLVPSQLYRTADGFIFIMCNKEKFWPVLCQRIDHPEWAEDPRFRSFKDRLANRELVNRLLDEALSARTTAAWLKHFAGQVPAAPVNDLRQALDNPFVTERGRIADYGPARMVAGPIIDPAAEAPRDAAPTLGADTDAVLRDHGFSHAEIDGLRADRVI